MREGTHPETFIADMQDIVNKLAIMDVTIPDEHLANVRLRAYPHRMTHFVFKLT